MKIQYCSDLHLEFQENLDFLIRNPIKPKGEILILAGDIIPFKVMDKQNDFFQFVSDHFQCTYWIPGNHEYYYYDAANKSGILNEKIKGNVFLVNNLAIERNHVKLIFSTLWSRISNIHAWQIENGISDFQVIKFNDGRFSSMIFNQFHDESLKFITSELHTDYRGKSVVVTHHVPTLFHYPEKYKRDALNEAFAVELFDLIETTQPDYWIYGHHHYNTPDFGIGSTQMLTNQIGYVKYNEHKYFVKDKTFNI